MAAATLVLLGLAAADLSWTQSQPQPRHVRLIIDRSLWMQLPVREADAGGSGADRGAMPAALRHAGQLAEQLSNHDRLDVRFVPPLSALEVPEPMRRALDGGRPAELAPLLHEAAAQEQRERHWAVDSAGDGLAAEAADAATWVGEGHDTLRAVYVISTQPLETDAGAHERFAHVRWPLAPGLVHFRNLAIDNSDVLVEVVAATDAPLTLEMASLDEAGDLLHEAEDGHPRRTVVHLVEAEDSAAGDSAPRALGAWRVRRMLAERPCGSRPTGDAPRRGGSCGVLVHMPGAVPDVRAVLEAPTRVAVKLPSDLPEADAVRLLDWLDALFPALAFERLPAAGTIRTRMPDALITWTTDDLADASMGTAVPAEWHDVPRLFIGPVPASANPFVSDEAPRPLALGPGRRVDRPGHAVLAAVRVQDLMIRDAHRIVAAVGLTRFEPLLSGEIAEDVHTEEDDVGSRPWTPLVAIAEEGLSRAVLIAGGAALREWPRRGDLPEAMLVSNALAWLLGDDPRILEDGSVGRQRGDYAGEPIRLPIWARAQQERGGRMRIAWRAKPDVADAAEPAALGDSWREMPALDALAERAGWFRVEVPARGGPTQAVWIRQPAALEANALANAVAWGALEADEPAVAGDAWLPAAAVESVRSGRPLWLTLALLGALLLAAMTARRAMNATIARPAGAAADPTMAK